MWQWFYLLTAQTSLPREHFCIFCLQVTTALMRKRSIARSLRTPENTGPSTADATTKNSLTGELTQVLMLDSGNPNTKMVNLKPMNLKLTLHTLIKVYPTYVKFSKIKLFLHIFQKTQVTWNKMVHKKRHHFLAQFSMPFHMVWSVLF